MTLLAKAVVAARNTSKSPSDYLGSLREWELKGILLQQYSPHLFYLSDPLL